MTRPTIHDPQSTAKHHAGGSCEGGAIHELLIDNFAGGGGASTGIERALGRPVDYAINHNPLALALHAANHPRTTHLCEDVWQVDPTRLCAGRPVGLAWFSPDCKHFSKAKGGRPVEKKIRGLAWVAVRWARAVRPRLIILENVEEFQTWGPLLPDHRPDPARRGLTFRRFIGHLRNLGYAVEWRELCAADYGAPTTRTRLFLIARCDNRPIVWPEPTHAPSARISRFSGASSPARSSRFSGAVPNQPDLFTPSLPPWRTAADCIDWTLPCPSIFERKRPLAEATLRRIAQGIFRYVLNNPAPFIIGYHAPKRPDDFRGQPLTQPLRTQTTENRFALVAPSVVAIDNKSASPASSTWPADSPLRTIVLENRFALVNAFLAKHGSDATAKRHAGVLCEGGHSLVTAAVVGVGARAGQSRPRALNEPLATVTAKGDKAIATAFLSKFYGTNCGADPRQPLPTITATGQHLAEVRAFLIKYYGCGCGQPADAPLDTVTTRDRFGLVTIAGIDYQIADIGLRMLTPTELAAAQGFPPDYTLTGTKSQQVAAIGNSVCPPLAEALTRANYCEAPRRHVRRSTEGGSEAKAGDPLPQEQTA